MGAEQRPRDVWSDLVGGLLDARSDPVSARFDSELAAAVDAGQLTEDMAHRLRFWQRASVRSIADHVRTVMPVALGALDAARGDAARYADEAAAVLGPPAEPPAEPPAADDNPEPPAASPRDEAPRVEPAANGSTQTGSGRRASTHDATEPSSLGAPSLVILADLTQAEPRI